MPSIPRPKLIQRLENSFRDSGFESVFLQEPTTKPFRLVIFHHAEQYSLIIYLWTLTKGGGTGRHRTDEYKIQMTLPDWQNGLLMEEGSITLVLGWSEDFQVWAGFDAQHHQTLTGRSNMVSIYGDALAKATQGQIGMSVKDNGETAVAFPSFALIEYTKHAHLFHGYAQQPNSTAIIEQATMTDFSDRPIHDIAPEERIRITQTIVRPFRNRRFRYNVLTAYNHRCAMTGMQLDLVEAAHIIDVAFDESTDEVKNGLCLSALCHSAFDAGLLNVLPDYRIVANKMKIADLQNSP